MQELFTLENLFTLFMLIVLQAVLGFDNLLYISLESKKAPKSKQQFARSFGIFIAIFLRVGLLFLLYNILPLLEGVFFHPSVDNIFEASFSAHSVIVLIGGAFIIFTAIKEIWHLIAKDKLETTVNSTSKSSISSVITWIVVMNLVFSFDSILSAMALSDSLIVMTIAIVISGGLMIWLSGHVSRFLEKNRLYEVLGLFILFIVGIMLVTEGGHLAHITLFGNKIVPMSKTTFYFVIFILVIVDVIQGAYQKKLNRGK